MNLTTLYKEAKVPTSATTYDRIQIGSELPFQNVLLSHPAFSPVLSTEYPERYAGHPAPLTAPPPSVVQDLGPLDSLGWPTAAIPLTIGTDTWQLGTFVLGGLRDSSGVDHFKQGTYHVAHEGSGVLSFSIDSSPLTAQVFPGGSGASEYVIVVTGPVLDGVGIKIESSDPTDPVRNMRMVHDSNWNASTLDANGTLDPDFVQALIDLKVKDIRAGNWKRITTSEVNHWDDELPVGYATYVPLNGRVNGGVPYEVLLELAAAVQCDLWLQVPARAFADPIAQTNIAAFCNQLGAVLNNWWGFANNTYPENVYVEYSNEVWNQSTTPNNYATTRAKVDWTPTDPTTWGTPIIATGQGRPAEWYAAATKATFAHLFAAVIVQFQGRLRWIVGGRITETFTTQWLRHVLDRLPGPTGGLDPSIYGYAIAPYCFPMVAALGPALGHVSYGATGSNDWDRFVSRHSAGTPTTASKQQFLTDMTNLLGLYSVPTPLLNTFTIQYAIEQRLTDLISYNPMPTLVAYEGGQGLTVKSTDCATLTGTSSSDPRCLSGFQGLGNDLDRVHQLFDAVNRDAGIYAFYDQLIRLWDAEMRLNLPAGYAVLFNHFNLSQAYHTGRNAYWGAFEYLHPYSASTTPPKAQAVRDFNTP